MVHYDYLVCPIEYSLRKDEILTDTCIRNPVFVISEYSLPGVLQSLTALVSIYLFNKLLCTQSKLY